MIYNSGHCVERFKFYNSFANSYIDMFTQETCWLLNNLLKDFHFPILLHAVLEGKVIFIYKGFQYLPIVALTCPQTHCRLLNKLIGFNWTVIYLLLRGKGFSLRIISNEAAIWGNKSSLFKSANEKSSNIYIHNFFIFPLCNLIIAY